MKKMNEWIALQIAKGVATMWCAYIFAAIALTSLPEVLATHSLMAFIAWLSQNFLQLVLLSVIMVGQKVIGDSHGELHGKIDELHSKIDAATME